MAENIPGINSHSRESPDPRLAKILDLLIRIGAGDLSARLDPGDTRDEVDGIIIGLNMMAEELDVNIRELNHKVAILTGLTEIDREIILKSKPQLIMEMVCRRAAEFLDVPKTILIIGTDPGHVAAYTGMKNPQNYVFNNDFLSPKNKSDKEQQFSNKISLFNRETVASLLGSEFLAEENIQTAALAPLTTENQFFGSLLLLDTKQRKWNEDELELLGLLAGQTAIALEGHRLFEDEKTRREELGSLYKLSRALNDSEPQTEKVLDLVARHALEAVHVTFVQVVLIEKGRLVIRAAYPVRIIDRDLRAGYNEPVTMAFLLGIMQNDSPAVIQPDDLSLSAAEKRELFLDIAQIMCIVPLRSAETGLGLIMLGEARRKEREPFSAEKLRLARGIGDQTVSALRRADLYQELENAYLETVLSLANAVDAKDTYTGGHGRQLAEMALALGRKMSMNPIELNDLQYGALLHDVGKIGIPDSILKKPGKLTEEEWIHIYQHPSIGEKILSPAHSLRGAASIVRHHHERYDGNGYPDSLSGDDIPLGARILSVIDAFCAMTDKRAYKEASSVEDAMAELERCSGSQFDPRIVKTFRELWEEERVCYA